MSTKRAISVLFVVAAAYDALLGAVFLVAAEALFRQFGVEPPNHFGYVQFPAALLLVFALMFAAIARDPRANRNLIPYGMLLKVSYCGVALYHWLTAGIPVMWKPMCLFDVVFLLLFAWAWTALGATGEAK